MAVRVIVAALGGGAGLLCGVLRGHSWLAVALCGAFFGALAVAAVIDLRERRIPNVLTYPGLLVGFGFAWLGGGTPLLLQSVGGAFMAGGLLLLFALLSRGGLGLGDVKLSAMAGSVLGPDHALAYLLLSAVIGLAASLVLLARGNGRHATFAYGPYLAASAVMVIVLRGLLVA